MDENRVNVNVQEVGGVKVDIKKIAILAVLTAVAYVVMVVGRIPIVLFLKYDPKDVIMAIGAFIYGPMAGLIMSVAVSLIEMLSVSDTGPWGFLMNVLSTCVLICPAAWYYRRNRTIKSAVIGLIIGSVLTVIVMMLWNYLVTPFYMGVPREKVAELLVPAFLPFNVFKVAMNSTLTVLLYKPVVKALRKAKLLPESTSSGGAAVAGKKHGVTIIALFVFATLVIFGLVLAGKI